MTLAETQQLRILERPRCAGKQPVTFGELRAGGIHFPAVVIGELAHNVRRRQEGCRRSGRMLVLAWDGETRP
jgi:hypothetical protein